MGKVNIYDHKALAVYILNEYKDRDDQPRTRYDRCGVAFPNKDGSINLKLDATPTRGQMIHIRPFEERERGSDDGGGGGSSSGRRRPQGDVPDFSKGSKEPGDDIPF